MSTVTVYHPAIPNGEGHEVVGGFYTEEDAIGYCQYYVEQGLPHLSYSVEDQDGNVVFSVSSNPF